MSEAIFATTESNPPANPEKRYQIYRDGVLHSFFLGTRAKASNHVRGLFNNNPSFDWEFELAA